ncbi:MAG: hypothetical protein H7338_16240 [Candidatus Sericytochromatia bacterium]|nr:hypothetical protein [Candidatus Sericytochromatia bacterium]
MSWTEQGDNARNVRSYALRNQDETVWIDPVDPGADLDKILALGSPTHVLVTTGAHDRAAVAVAQRYKAQLWVPVGGTLWLAGADHQYGDGAALPAGLTALRLDGGTMGDSVLHGRLAGLVIAFLGDSVICVEKAKASWLMRCLFIWRAGVFQRNRFFIGGNRRKARASLQQLRALKLDMAFVTHGEAVIGLADESLAESLASW